MWPKTNLIVLLLSLIFFFFACEKEEYSFISIAQKAEITCEERPSEYYFKGFINGEKICFHSGFDDYQARFSRGVGVTTKNTFDLNSENDEGAAWGTFFMRPLTKFPPGTQHIEILSPEFPSETSKQEILNELIRNQDFTIVEEEERVNSYDFRWLILDQECSGKHGRIHSFGGPQPNAYLRITELETEEYDDRVFYTMTLEMACDLYIGGIASRHYGRLEDGKMRLAFSLNKE